MPPSAQTNTSNSSPEAPSSPATPNGMPPTPPAQAPLVSSSSPSASNLSPATSSEISPQSSSHPSASQATPTESNFKLPTQAPIWLTFAAILFGVFSIAFGAYELNCHIEAQDQIESLQAELDSKNQTITKLGAQLGLKVDEYNNPIYTAPDSTQDSTVSSQYVYIGEWGIKIKIPDSLHAVSYMYDGFRSDRPSISITGSPSNITDSPEYANILKNPHGFGTLTRYRLDDVKETLPQGQSVYQDDQYLYVYFSPQTPFSIDPTEIQQETSTLQLIKTMLTDPNNFSSI